ncbi:hypothetical protein F0562_027954 [Nyssa sinensis]|uniref:Hydroxyproline-rich glycoprotein family protein n=1 Tax=Nyssa sinensis TaxID=561372 RepID=A0A5J5B4U5_9ASTE|nr:hypothetical protein F0562_027954 [Nyssa sinensis]
MEKEEGWSRPSIGFPLGLALLLLILISISFFFSCCYHWEKLRALLQSSMEESAEIQTDSAHSSPKSIVKSEPNEGQSFTILMPGDDVPKFVALPRPCELHK